MSPKKRSGSHNCVSMTGFARVSGEYESGSVTIEVRAVNSRYLDSIVRLPRELSDLESTYKKEISKFCKRGRVEVTLMIDSDAAAATSIVSSPDRFRAFMDEAEAVLKPAHLWDDEMKRRLATEVLIRKDIFSEEANEGELGEEVCLEFLTQALKSLRSVQSLEGAELAQDISERLARIGVHLQRIQKIHDGLRAEYTEDLREKLKEYLDSSTLPEERLVSEVAVMVERSDISEEVTRLESHLARFPEVMLESPCGRKLDFLLQECVREVNTIAAKIQNAEAQHLVVEAKAELERVKEQVQNLE